MLQESLEPHHPCTNYLRAARQASLDDVRSRSRQREVSYYSTLMASLSALMLMLMAIHDSTGGNSSRYTAV